MAEQEELRISALSDSALSLRRCAEECLAENDRLIHALAAYREAMQDDVSGNVAEAVSAIHHTFNDISHAYADAYRQLGIAEQMLTKYERIGSDTGVTERSGIHHGGAEQK